MMKPFLLLISLVIVVINGVFFCQKFSYTSQPQPLMRCLNCVPLVTNGLYVSYEMLRKQCVKRYSSFDFLTEIVNKVPDLGGGESCGDERGLPRRR